MNQTIWYEFLKEPQCFCLCFEFFSPFFSVLENEEFLKQLKESTTKTNHLLCLAQPAQQTHRHSTSLHLTFIQNHREIKDILT